MKLMEIIQNHDGGEKSLEEARKKSLAYLDIERRRLFLTTLLGDSYDRSYPYKFDRAHKVKHSDDFINSIYSQWQNWGRLSEKQVEAVLRYADKAATGEAISDMLPDLKVGVVFTFIGVVTKVDRDIEVEVKYGTNITNRVTLITPYGARVAFKTTRGNLLKLADESLNQNKKLKVIGKISWIKPDFSFLTVKALGIKVTLA